MNTLVLRILDGFDKHVSSWILLSHRGDNRYWGLGLNNSTGFTGLHNIAHLGIIEIAARLLEMKK